MASKIALVLLISALSALLVAPSVSARKTVVFREALAYQDESSLSVVVGFASNERVSNSRVTVSIPDFGIRSSRKVDFSNGNSKVAVFDIPFSEESGYVRIVFNSDEGRRAKYIPIY